MPIYEYGCDVCNKRIEVMQKFSDSPLERCEFCGGHLRKLVSNTSFVLKGSGWYADGYSSAGSASSGAAAPSSSTDSGGSSSSGSGSSASDSSPKSDAKPGAKPVASGKSSGS
jgi:putative FmdB family regulatory protein